MNCGARFPSIISKLFVSVSLSILSVGSLVAAEPKTQPNVILIVADDMGYSDLGCYGSEIETPNLDGLAKNGLRFTQVYNSARCWPSRAALMTGYYAQQIHRDVLPNETGGYYGVRQPWAPVLSDLLKPAGYRNYHSGKWHIDGKVLENGFDRSFCLEKNFSYFSSEGNLVDDRPDPVTNKNYYSTLATSAHALECLKDHAARYKDRPFFHLIAFTAPHFPLQALPEDIAKYRDRYLEGWDVMRNARYAREKEMGIVNTPLSPLEREVGPPYYFKEVLGIIGPGEVNRPLPWTELTEEQRRFQATKMAIHAAMVDRMDREIGRIIAQLKEMGAFDNTMILFVSDNGASAEMMVRHGGHDPKAEPGSANTYLCLGPGFSSACNTPLRRHKSWVYEGGISTPLVVHWPKGIAARNELRHTPGHLIDIVPTVLEAAGVQRPTTYKGEAVPPAPGRSLVPAFNKDVPIVRDSLWWLHEGNRAIRVGDWKLVADNKKPWELYDLKIDRAEQHNLADKMPEKVRQLERVWQDQTDSFTELTQKTLPPPPEPKPAKPLNVLVLYADDWRHDTLGAAGNPVLKTPNLDSLASQGVRFTYNCVTTSICGVSRASLFTGQWMARHGNTAMKEFKTPWAETYPGLLRTNGYFVGHVGKWHNGKFPAECFDFGRSYNGRHWMKQPDGTPIHVTQKNENDALEFLKTRPADKPFCLTLAFIATHAEDGNPKQFLPQPESMSLFKDVTIPVPKTATEEALRKLPPFLSDEKNEGRKRWHWRFDTPEKYQEMMKNYYRLASEVDTTCGRVLEELKRQGELNNTLVIFVGDNGYFHGEHGLADKWYPHQESIRVPLIIRDPRLARSKRGMTNDDFTLNVDLAPTILAATGIAVPKTMQGSDIAPLYLAEKKPNWRSEFFYEHATHKGAFIPGSEALVRKDWKYFYWPDYNLEQLFHVAEDTCEENDLAKDPAQKERLAEMRTRFAELKAAAK